MAKEIFMPKLSSTMEVGTLLQWYKEEGDPVEIGDPLFEIMTDKINIEVEAYDEGYLLRKYYREDDQVPVNHIIGYVGQQGEKVPDTSPGVSGGESTTEDNHSDEKAEKESFSTIPSSEDKTLRTIRATPAARRIARIEDIDLENLQGSGDNGRIQKRDVLRYIGDRSGNQKITPLARKISEAKGLNPTSIKGTGSRGKIMKKDVLTHISGQQDLPHSPHRKKISGMRKVIAERMANSAYSAPHVTISTEVDMANAKKLREVLLPIIEKQTGFRLSYTELLVKSCAIALKRHMNINVSITGDELIEHGHVNIGLAVAVPDGLLVPVLKDADSKGLAEITKEAKKLGESARKNQLKPDQLKGSTFTISNLGMYAVDIFTPIINQPESAILGVGRILEKPVAYNGRVEIRPMMTINLSFDHRTIDGAPAAAFLTELKQILENPYELLV